MAVLSAGENLWTVKARREEGEDWSVLPMPNEDGWYVKPTWVKFVFHRPRGAGGWRPLYTEFHGSKCKPLRLGGWSTRNHGHGVVRLSQATYYCDAVSDLSERARDIAERSWRTQETTTRRSGGGH